MQHSLEKWLATRRRSTADWEPLRATYRRSLVDLAALRFSPPIAGGHSLPAAGLPWFMAMFGRDSILTSLQALPFVPELAATTLRALGDWQGSRVDDFREEDPGRILHEMRYGETAAFEEQPHSPYYGNADATPLFVVLLDEYERWTGDTDAGPRARAGGPGRAGLDRRVRRPGRATATSPTSGATSETGLENQCWKDSWDSISYSRRPAARLPAGHLRAAGLRLRRQDPRRPPGPRDLEGPGVRRPAGAAGGRPQAAVQPDFWVADGQYFALALDADGTPGRRAVVEHRPPAVERHRRQVQGAGRGEAPARARACSPAGACGPWPRARRASTRSATTSARSGRSTTRSSRGACAATASRRRPPGSPAGILDAAEFFEGRLPEAFGGYERSFTRYPGPVPDRLQPAGLVDRRAAAAAAHHARAGAARRAPPRRPGAADRRSGISSCSTSPAAGAAWTPSAAPAPTCAAPDPGGQPQHPGGQPQRQDQVARFGRGARSLGAR